MILFVCIYNMYLVNCENVENYVVKGKCIYSVYPADTCRQIARIFNFLSHLTPKSLDNSGNFD